MIERAGLTAGVANGASQAVARDEWDLLLAIGAAALAVLLEWLREKIAERQARRRSAEKVGGTD